jgi:superfamily II DNA or RNA helicase
MVFVPPTLEDKDVDVSVGQPTALSNGQSETKEGLHGRAYQHEMLGESMKRNIIVAADTGSGKTLMLESLSRKKTAF